MAAKSALANEVKAAYSEQNDSTSGYIPAQPAAGKADFDRYINENIRRPDTTASGQSVLVVLNFVVNAAGKIDSIRVIRSPGKIFSDEAIRLIKEGPMRPLSELCFNELTFIKFRILVTPLTFIFRIPFFSY
jgi:outer membrane biosynthesis protein TonB